MEPSTTYKIPIQDEDELMSKMPNENKINTTSSIRQYLEKIHLSWVLESETPDFHEERKPLLEELDINVVDMFNKLKIFLSFDDIQLNDQQISLVTQHPDFWGPFFGVLIYSLLSLWGQIAVITWIFVFWLVGSFVIFFLSRALGTDISYSGTVGIIGYGILPLIFVAMLRIFIPYGFFYILFHICGVLWSTFASGKFLLSIELSNKRIMLLYPIFLLYSYFLSLHSGV